MPLFPWNDLIIISLHKSPYDIDHPHFSNIVGDQTTAMTSINGTVCTFN